MRSTAPLQPKATTIKDSAVTRENFDMLKIPTEFGATVPFNPCQNRFASQSQLPPNFKGDFVRQSTLPKI